MAKAYRQKHPERVNKWRKQYRDTHPEQCARRKRAYTEANREMVNAAARKYRSTHLAAEIERKAQYRRLHPEVVRAQYFKHKYGITAEQKQAMFDGQRGLCASCGDPLIPGQQTHVDHDHATGQIRGLLCRRCNAAEGFLLGSALRAEKLAAYLKRNAPKLKIA